MKLGEIISVLTDYHANGAYKILKKNVKLLDSPDYAVMIRTKNFEQNDFIDDLKYINEHAYNFLTKSKVFPNDILMNKIANAGSVYCMPKLDQPVSLAMNLFLIRINKDLAEQKYIYYYLKCNEKYVKSFANGAATNTITKESVRNLEVILPNRSIQKKIISTIYTYEKLIENNIRRIEILEEMAQRIYKEWFVNFKYPGHENDELVDSELGLIPEGWEVKEFGENITFIRGKNITKKQMVHGEIPVVSAGINPSGFHNTSNVNGPVVTISASGANAGYISYYLRNIWAADCSYINNEMTPYIFYYFSFVKFNSKEITNLQRGAAQPHVYLKDVARISIIDPKIETIKEFEKIAVNMFNEIGILRKKIINLRQTRDFLLPKLISGKVDVSELDIDTNILDD